MKEKQLHSFMEPIMKLKYIKVYMEYLFSHELKNLQNDVNAEQCV